MSAHYDNLFITVTPLGWKGINLCAWGKMLGAVFNFNASFPTWKLIHNVTDKAPLRHAICFDGAHICY